MSYYPLITHSQPKTEGARERVVKLEFPTKDVVRFIKRGSSITDSRCFDRMRSHINESISLAECRAELDRMLIPDDASNAFDFLTQVTK